MEDGRRERVVISCVTFDTCKISKPIGHYEATKVHLIHYVKEPGEADNVYARFYDRVTELIQEERGGIPIVEHMENVSDFSTMLRVTYNIIRDEYDRDPNADIFVNISAGTSEYAAAAIMAAMMFPTSIPFSVPTDRYHVPTKYYFDGDTPVGLAESVRSPRVVPRYDIGEPDQFLVLGLAVLDRLTSRAGAPKGPEVIRNLKSNGIWFRKRSSGDRSDAVYYHRDFVKKWDQLGWVYRDVHEKRYYVTSRGKMIIETFFRTEQERLDVVPDEGRDVFVKGTWYPEPPATDNGDEGDG